MYIGVDIGGMSIKAGIVSEDGKILTKCAVPTPCNDEDAFCRAMLECIKKAMDEANIGIDEIKSIGVGSPSAVEREEGILLEAENIGYKRIYARDFLQKSLGDIPVFVDNDANCAALGEYYKSKKSPHFIFITLGTGIGGGVILDGKLFLGSNGAAGELGHIVTRAGGRECNCGRRGCWEKYGSMTGLIETATERRDEMKSLGKNDEITGKLIFDLSEKGDDGAKKIVSDWIEEVAIGVVDMINIFQPDEIVIGGAVSAQGDVILLPLIDYAKKHAFCADEIGIPEISMSKIGGDAGIIGAAFLHKNN
ncbi:MAG: ROK family protein [Clostridia bacterium]|nr:ROK family protein [Clostridia bacterium]